MNLNLNTIRTHNSYTRVSESNTERERKHCLQCVSNVRNRPFAVVVVVVVVGVADAVIVDVHFKHSSLILNLLSLFLFVS